MRFLGQLMLILAHVQRLALLVMCWDVCWDVCCNLWSLPLLLLRQVHRLVLLSLLVMFQDLKQPQDSLYFLLLQVQRLALLSLLAVFKDILPAYRIRPPTEKELQVRVQALRCT